MGTPELAAVVLRRLADWPGGEVLAVYTQPDRPAGRGQKLRPSPVKEAALELGLPVRQPENFRDAESVAELAALAPDVLAVAAYGLILPQAVLDIPRLAPLNVHTSLLPRYRGAAPIQRAIMENWQPGAESGVSIMRMEKGLDTGPVYTQRRIALAEQTAGSLHDALAALGAEALLEVIGELCAGTAVAVPQDEGLASYAAKVFKEDGYVDWSLPLAAVHAQIRGVTPFPGARTLLQAGELTEPLLLQIWPGEPEAFAGGERPVCGSLRRDKAGLSVACADGWYRLGRVRPPAKKEMDALALCNGLLQKMPLGISGTASRPEA
ncbi:methionyl-tRNA formyltransferase [uncultured Desulfovibrio sp.]|uniref:methionyl-tRNA formyltransferase n=1 Tax=uncultured Desulfovibrio sp. TaxID=167968 RepID=UPI00262E75E0|nr:methionyl-tRNA formyltransferase [uncultured Desulfovibrio sp.]